MANYNNKKASELLKAFAKVNIAVRTDAAIRILEQKDMKAYKARLETDLETIKAWDNGEQKVQTRDDAETDGAKALALIKACEENIANSRKALNTCLKEGLAIFPTTLNDAINAYATTPSDDNRTALINELLGFVNAYECNCNVDDVAPWANAIGRRKASARDILLGNYTKGLTLNNAQTLLVYSMLEDEKIAPYIQGKVAKVEKALKLVNDEIARKNARKNK